MMLELKQNKQVKEREWENTPKLSVLKSSRRKRRLNMMLELKQNKQVKEREWENTPKELDI